jgi:predicted methyltransferase
LADPVVNSVAAAVGLAEGTRGVEAVLAALGRLEPVSVRALSRAADLPVPIVAAICNEFRRRGQISHTRPVQFTLEGRRRFKASATGISAICSGCGGRRIALPPAIARLRPGLAAVAEAAPPPLVQLDQCHCTAKTKLRRVLAMHDADAIARRRILLIGDDDLISVTLLRFVRILTLQIEELVVVDLDERLLAFIRQQLDSAPFPFRCLRHDVRQPITGQFDTVVTDPPCTAAGASLFLTRAREVLAGERADVFFSFGSRRPGVQFAVQQTISKLGLEIRSLTRDFNDYIGAGALAGTSHLYHLAPSHHTLRCEEPLYTGARTTKHRLGRA